MDDSFCAGSVLNWTELWLTNPPIVSDCFCRVNILCISTAYAIVSVLLLIFKSSKDVGHRAVVNSSKRSLYILLRLSLVVLWLVFCIPLWIMDNSSQIATHFMWSLVILCGIVDLIVIWINFKQRHSVTISAFQFLFYLLFTILYLPTFYQAIDNYEEEMSIMILDVILLILSILNIIATVIWSPLRAMIHDPWECPEKYAEMPSKLFFSWLNPIIAKAYKQKLEKEDVFDLRGDEDIKYNYTRFYNAWKQSGGKPMSQQQILDEELNKNKYYRGSTSATTRASRDSSSNRLRRGSSSKKLLDQENVPLLNYHEKPSYLTSSPPIDNNNHRDQQMSFKQQGSRTTKWSLYIALIKTFFPALSLAWLLYLLQALLQFSNPFLLEILISFVTDRNQSAMWHGLLLGVVFFIVGSIVGLMHVQHYFISYNVSLRVQSTLIGAIYRKAMIISSVARQKYSSGEIVNLMSVDVERIQGFLPFSSLIVTTPIQIVLCIIFLWQQLGIAILAGLAVLIIVIPLNIYIISFVRKQDVKQLESKDKRLKLLHDILNGIRVLKLYAWEKSFEERVTNYRSEEVRSLSKIYYGWSFVTVIWDVAPFVVMLVTFLTFIYTGDGSNVLTPSRAFVSLTLFNMIRLPMMLLPWSFTYAVNSFVSLNRVIKFLSNEEISTHGYEIQSQPNVNAPAVEIERGSFSWSDTTDDVLPVLQEIDLKINHGSFIAIVGKIGVGKSSLLSAMIGDMLRLNGKVKINGKLAYVPQTSWIQHMTVKENILFGSVENTGWYNTVLDKCALRSDLNILPKGDETEIGERGLNLSGGQKQRVSLARAVYQRADIYLLDDPLSAVDAHVGKELFFNLLAPGGILSRSTRILVTHGLQWLPYADEIIVLGDDGRIAERGKYEELLANGADFSEVIRNNTTQGDTDIQERIAANLDQMKEEMKKNMRHNRRQSRSQHFSDKVASRTLSTDPDSFNSSNREDQEDGEENEETTAEGGVSYRVYLDYLRSRGFLITFFAVLGYGLFSLTNVFTGIWIQKFTEDPTILNASNYKIIPPDLLVEVRKSTDFYMTGYGLTGGLELLEIILFALCNAQGAVHAARVLHHKLLVRILRAPLLFFDTTPNGRIVNRFSKDIEVVDTVINEHWNDCLQTFFTLIAAIGAVVYSTPWFLIAILPLMIIYYFIQKYYIPVARQSRRLASVARSPVFTHFTESVAGITVIRAYRQIKRFIDRNDHRVNHNARFTFLKNAGTRWLIMRLHVLGSLIVFFAVLFAVFSGDIISAALVGLSISYALTVTENLRWMVMQSAELETDLVAVERITEYSSVDQEDDWIREGVKLPQNWPHEGALTFDGYGCRYRSTLPLVIKNLTINIERGEKIGIVGRTGAGKSSLTLAVFRLIEAAKGKIFIDGINIQELGLHQLRSRITILPQDPVLFNGTLRDNIDPFNAYSDADLWRILESAHLKDWASQLPLGLSHECGEGGQNLSVGQRQLICLARALLRKTKVLVLDEATAAVDQDTDRLLMQTIFEKFHQSTILIIAHRLNTILGTNRVIVMRDGEIIETGPPYELMKNPATVFYGMAKEAGLVEG